jgi:radical SAM protein with 4Fe4S-binding SPASM domain
MLFRQLGNPKRLLNYVGLNLAFRLKLERVPFLPVTLDVEPNNICNFECPHCQVTHWDKAPVQLDTERFKNTLRQLPQLARVKLQGMGEPLLNKKLIEMLREGEKRGISMRFTTNGSVYTDQIARGLAALENTFITVSIDGATPEVFEQIRVKGKFDKVVANVQNLVRTRGGRSFPKINIWCVVTRKNVHQLGDLVRLAKRLGVDGITLQLFVSNWGKESMDAYTDPIRLERNSPELSKHISEARQIAENEKVNLQVFENNLLSQHHKCPWPWTSAYICANGDVVPCCVIADSETVKLGNVFEKPFKEIWNSEPYQQFRQRIRNHDLPSYCRNCYSDPPPAQQQSTALKILQ